MTIALPTLPRDASYSMRPVKGASSVLRPAFGGPRLPLARKGDHWAIDVDVGSLDPDCAAALIADLVRASGETVSLALPTMGTDAPLAADAKVWGAGQAGSLLTVDELPVGYTVRKGRFFSLITAVRRYVYIVTAPIVADGSGRAILPIWPMLRAAPADNDVVELRAPRIEGFIDDGGQFERGLLPLATIAKFAIEERA